MEDKKKKDKEQHICHCGHGGAHQCHHEDSASDSRDHGHKHSSEEDSCECCQ